MTTTPPAPDEKPGGIHTTPGPPPPLPDLPAIPADLSPEDAALLLLKGCAANKMIRELDVEIRRQDQMSRTALARIAESPPASRHSTLRSQIPHLIKFEKDRRHYKDRQVALGKAAEKEANTVAEAVCEAIRGVCDVSVAVDRLRQHEAARLPEVESRIRSMLHTATQQRTPIGLFHQDALVDDLGRALAARARTLKLGAAKDADALLAVVECFSPPE